MDEKQNLKHSPTPWKLSGLCVPQREIKDAQNYDVALCDLSANANFIIDAVNSHESIKGELASRQTRYAELEERVAKTEADLLKANKEIKRLLKAAEMEFQRAEGKEEMKKWFQEEIHAEKERSAQLVVAISISIEALKSMWNEGNRHRFVTVGILEEALAEHKKGMGL